MITDNNTSTFPDIITMAPDYSNHTIYGIHNPTERNLWTGYHTLVLLSSLLGDTAILVGSIKFNAFKLHEFLVPVIQHIAVCDLILSVVYVLPNLVSLVADCEVMSHFICVSRVYVVYAAFGASVNLVCLLTSSKLLILEFPLHTRYFTKTKANLVCFLIWILSLGSPISMLIVDKSDVLYDYMIYSCDYMFTAEIWTKFLRWILFFLAMSANIIVLLTTLRTLVHLVRARRASLRSHGQVRWQGMVTVLATATVFCLSNLPYAAYSVAERYFVRTTPQLDPVTLVPYRRAAKYLLLLNVMSNFYIYSLTVPSFRGFVVELVMGGRRVLLERWIQRRQVGGSEIREKTLVTDQSEQVTAC